MEHQDTPLSEPQASEEVSKLGEKIWRLAPAGKDRDQIAEQLRISIETLCAYRSRLEISLNHYRLADNAKINPLIKSWLPLALASLLIKSRQVFAENDLDSALDAGMLVLQFILTDGGDACVGSKGQRTPILTTFLEP